MLDTLLDLAKSRPLMACAVAAVVLPLIIRWLRPMRKVAGRTVFITGGSEGIGKSLAEELVRRGANVVIFARTVSKLEAAIADLKPISTKTNAKVGFRSMDVTSAGSVSDAIDSAVAEFGTPHGLIACAGSAKPGYFLEQGNEVFERTMDLNYMGNVRVIKKVAPLMVDRRDGDIMIVSSAAGVCTFIGYASYSPSKFAQRGLADALRNELSGFGIRVSVCYPPDTDTPGFQEEMKTKPKETLACFPADAYKPDAVAKQTVSSWLRGDYHITSVDILQNLLVSSMAGVTPRAFPVIELLLAPLIALVEQVFAVWFDYQARKYANRVQTSKKED
eukprot:Hpha_TRINITY_DN6432_c0_g1::TRINITY_DN6432_c0_g1_i1::g.127::m.127/K04708/E1.1.1.102; 3-dehydrosphinganine reductase